ncbi:bis(5'-nucleosyl)-tetraphosphatase (symmetrical) YqeK [Dehalococcoidia bacterium]|nr:bis(5'-nucleosyl)-tetraphosphatase (symmetrical) YqeK [Dehalococcoidia bacterium]
MRAMEGGRVLRAIGRLPDEVRDHIEHVRQGSIELAQRFELDVDKAEFSAVGHDICRVTPPKELIEMARLFQIPVTPLDEQLPVFLHGPVGAEVLKSKYVIEDEEVLNPIRCHTMGKQGMSPLDKVLFLADKIEPRKVGRYPFIAEVVDLAKENLDQALLCFLDHQIKAFLDHGDVVHPGMLAARDEIALGLEGRS